MKLTSTGAIGAALAFALGLTSHAQASLINPGDLVISEFLANPASVSDTLGEWFELFNRAAHPLDINGLELADDGSNDHVIDAGGELLVPSGAYFLLARNGDPSVNGGVTPGYVYADFSLGNSTDQIALRSAGIEIARVDYGSALVQSGRSTELVGLPNSYALTPAELVFGAGDIGTPGGPGSVPLQAATASDPPVAVSEPAALMLLGSGLLGLMIAVRTRGAGSPCLRPAAS